MPRYRETDNVVNQSLSTTFVTWGGSTTQSAPYGVASGVWKSIEDVPHVRFKERSQKGELMFAPMTKMRQVFGSELTGFAQQSVYTSGPAPSSAIKTVSYPSFLNWKLGSLPKGLLANPLSIFTEAEITDSSTRAATAALANWKEASVQSYVLLAELQKTLNTLRNPLKALVQMMEEGRRRGYSFKGGLNGVSGQYLTWFYGIRTVMFDIEGTLEALRAKASDRHTARGGDTLSSTVVTPNQLLHTGATVSDSRWKKTHIETIEHRAGLIGQFDAEVTEVFGLRLSDVPAAIWELIPWSFVADWFFNLGDYIQALSVDTQNGVKGQWLTSVRTVYYERRVTSVTTTPRTGADYWVETKSCADMDYGMYMTTSRSLLNLADHTGIKLRANLDRTPLLAALALVTQQFTKR